MIAWEKLDSGPVSGQMGQMELWRRGEDYVIRVDGRELMSSRVFDSERQLAALACERHASDDPKVLVGGLGMGFTLGATLEVTGEGSSIVVAEISKTVIAWNEGILGPLAGRPLEDSRVSVHQGDIRDLIEGSSPFDVILLDVDNGPEAFTRSSNAWLYEPAGLRAMQAAMNPGGVLAVWAAFEAPRFTSRLQKCGYEVDVIGVRARGGKGARHTIWLAERS